MSNRIVLGGDYRADEALASGTVKPGMLLERTSTGAMKAHATEGGFAEKAVAVEDALQGKTVSDSYANGALVQFAVVENGADVYMLLKAGENVAKGAMLISAGDGTLIAVGSIGSGHTLRQTLFVANEAKNLSTQGAVDTLISVRTM